MPGLVDFRQFRFVSYGGQGTVVAAVAKDGAFGDNTIFALKFRQKKTLINIMKKNPASAYASQVGNLFEMYHRLSSRKKNALQELSISKEIHHPLCAELLAAFQTDLSVVFMMPFYHGGNLREIIQTHGPLKACDAR